MKDESFIKQAPSAIFFTIRFPQISHQILAQEVAVPSSLQLQTQTLCSCFSGDSSNGSICSCTAFCLFLSPPSTGHMKGRKYEDGVTFLVFYLNIGLEIINMGLLLIFSTRYQSVLCISVSSARKDFRVWYCYCQINEVTAVHEGVWKVLKCGGEGLRHWQFLLLKFHLSLTPIPAPQKTKTNQTKNNNLKKNNKNNKN